VWVAPRAHSERKQRSAASESIRLERLKDKNAVAISLTAFPSQDDNNPDITA